MNLLELPDFVLEEIFQRLSYDDIAKKRLVSKKINSICQSLLNRSIAKLQSCIASKIEKLKPLVPRKDSQRWNNSAAIQIRYYEEIISNVRVLSFMYKPYIETNLCCFIPGNVIDISFNLLRRRKCPKIMLYDKPLEEFNDQICMAKEHFQEHIEPTLRKLEAKLSSMQNNEEAIQPTFVTVESLLDKSDGHIARKVLPAATTQSHVPSLTTTIDQEPNSKKNQLQGHDNCRKAYLRINRKYNTFLKKVERKSKAIKKQFSNYRKEMADLRLRLHYLESQNRTLAVEQIEDDKSDQLINFTV